MYVLLIIFGTYNSITSQQISFDHKDACLAAKKQVETSLNDHKRNAGYTVECISKILEKKK